MICSGFTRAVAAHLGNDPAVLDCGSAFADDGCHFSRRGVATQAAGFDDMLKALSIVGYLGMFGAAIAQFATGNLFSSFPVVIAVQAVAILIVLLARLVFGRRSFHVVANPTEGGLVTTGPYRYIRHPIYTGLSIFSLAGAVGHWSWESMLLTGLLASFALLRIFCEEVMVTARYPEYLQYSANTWRMIPYIF